MLISGSGRLQLLGRFFSSFINFLIQFFWWILSDVRPNYLPQIWHIKTFGFFNSLKSYPELFYEYSPFFEGYLLPTLSPLMSLQFFSCFLYDYGRNLRLQFSHCTMALFLKFFDAFQLNQLISCKVQSVLLFTMSRSS